jgi:hypothetical protein
MQSHSHEAEQFGGRTVPPATPPVINAGASASDALRADAGGDSDFPGKSPDEVQPGQGDFDQPDRSPEQEVPNPGGDTDRPGQTPAETPAQPDMPRETPPPD